MSYQVEPKEQLLWERLRQRSNPGETVRLLEIAGNIGLHHQRAKQYSRKWQNNNLVVSRRGGDVYITLTEKGRKVEKLEEM